MLSSQKLTDKLLKQTRRDLIGWNDRPSMIETSWDEPNQELTAYAQGTPDFVSVRSCIARFISWRESLFQAEVLEKGTYNPQQFAMAAHHAYWYVVCSEPLANRGRGGDVLLTTAAHAFAMQIIAGLQARAHVVGDVLVKGLDTPLIEAHEGSSWAPHVWFLLHLYTRWRGLPSIDTARYSYPDPKKMAVYDAVLANWQSLDVQQVAGWCNDMAEYHVRNAWNPTQDEVREFDHGRATIWPYEIFAYLRLREWQKLPNPDQASLTHALFNQPFGLLLPALPDDSAHNPVVDAALAVYRTEYSDLRQD